jgi:serine/threonine-protein kinase
MACIVFVLFLAACVVVGMYHVLPRRVFRALFRCAGVVLFGLGLLFLFRELVVEGGVRSPAGVFGFLLLCGLTFLYIKWLTWLFPAAPRPARPRHCPPIRLLKDLLAERLSAADQSRLAAHLEACTACQHRVEGLTAGRDAWSGLARPLAQAPPALQQVIDSLKGDPGPEATRDEPVFAADLPLGFLSPSDKPGQLGRLERYEVLEEVGRGGMGVVLKAFDPTLHRVVAIKVLAPQLATSGVARKRFLREAKAAAAVTHDHIVTIHAVEEANGLPYLVMQYVAGLSLQDRLDRDGPLELPDVLRIGTQTAAALAAAHGQGIVHRDVKPANILLEEGVGRVKITDFGLARAMDDASLTQSGFVAGSPLFMAPEQARGEAIDHRADLFSLGSVLYAMCTGRPPFRAANTLAVLRRVCDDDPRPVRETNPEVPDWLAAVIEKLHAKDPARRFASAAEVAALLGQHLAQLQHPSWAAPPAPAANADPGLPTSLTLCPSCGVNLHVPDKMLGTVVHCEQCGKPFRVEEASEEIRVARAVPPPFGPPPRVRTARGWPGPHAGKRALLWLGGGGALLLLFLLALAAHEGRTHAPPVPAMVTTLAPPPAVADAFLKEPLRWFPPEALLFGSVDLRPFGSLQLGHDLTQTALRLAFPAQDARQLTPENLGRIRIDGVSLAYYEGRKGEKRNAIFQLEGLALDGHKRSVEYARDALPGAQISPAGNPTRILSPALPFALGVCDDSRVFLARSFDRAGKDPLTDLQVLQSVAPFAAGNRPRAAGDLLSGYQPPWVKTALNETPRGACGLALGEIPAAWRKALTETLGLRACPRTFAFHLERQGAGVAFTLSLYLDKAGAEQVLLEDLETWRRGSLNSLLAAFPALRQEPLALALVGERLQTHPWRIPPGRGCVQTQVSLHGPALQALGTLLRRVAQTRWQGEKRPRG